MNMTPDITRYVAQLSGLALSEAELTQMTEDLKSIVAHMDILGELDTRDVAPLTHVLPDRNVLRQDDILPSVPREALLQNAPRQKDGCFLVPRAVE